MPYFNLAKNCKTNTGQGCFAKNVMYKGLDGSDFAILDNSSTDYKVLTIDGMSISLGNFYFDCTNDAGTSGALLHNCASAFIDINGSKGPNVLGKDLLTFWINATNVLPFGTKYDKNSWGPAKYGWKCTNFVLEKNKVCNSSDFP